MKIDITKNKEIIYQSGKGVEKNETCVKTYLSLVFLDIIYREATALPVTFLMQESLFPGLDFTHLTKEARPYNSNSTYFGIHNYRRVGGLLAGTGAGFDSTASADEPGLVFQSLPSNKDLHRRA
ncbi:hypothetical protein ACJX0J_015201 [Zea mays]